MILNINSPMIKVRSLEKIIIDTNILMDVFYSNISKEVSSRERNYQNFINKCLNTNIPLYTTEYNLFEAFHLIDKINKDIYEEQNGKKITIKEYHKIEEERIKARKQLKIFYDSVKQTTEILFSYLSNSEIEEYLENTDNTYDLYDFALLKVAVNNEFKYLLTHDADFYSNIDYVSNINILTQNSTIINNAE